MSTDTIIPIERLEKMIYLIRGHKVMLDEDLAELYGVTTKRLNEQVRRNKKRFPEDFMFRLSGEEHEILRSQIATSKKGSGGRRYPPYAFTEQGVAMLSGVLNSDRAIKVNIEIMRAFVKLRHLLDSHEKLARKLIQMEKKYDKQFRIVFDAIRELMEQPVPEKRRIEQNGAALDKLDKLGRSSKARPRVGLIGSAGWKKRAVPIRRVVALRRPGEAARAMTVPGIPSSLLASCSSLLGGHIPVAVTVTVIALLAFG